LPKAQGLQLNETMSAFLQQSSCGQWKGENKCKHILKISTAIKKASFLSVLHYPRVYKGKECARRQTFYTAVWP